MPSWVLQSSSSMAQVIILLSVIVSSTQSSFAAGAQSRRSFIKGCSLFLAGVGVGVLGTRKFDSPKLVKAPLPEQGKAPETPPKEVAQKSPAENHKGSEKPQVPEPPKVNQIDPLAENSKAGAPTPGYWKSLAEGTRDSVLPDFAARHLPENLYAKTAAEALSITLGVDLPYATSIYFLRKWAGKEFLLGGNAGLGSNEGVARELRLSLTKAFYLGVVKAPIIEELLFRALPGAISKTWWMGVPSSLAFGIIHNFYREKGRMKFSRTIPVPQIYGGLYFWWLQRHRGFSHSILAHSTQNLLLPAALLYYKVRNHSRRN